MAADKKRKGPRPWPPPGYKRKPPPPELRMGLGLYVLDANGEPREVAGWTEGGTGEWAAWLENADREPGKTERTTALTEIGPFRVSTVFLAIDHNFAGKGPPVLWETMIFCSGQPAALPPEGEGWADYQARYSSKADALAGHETACEMIRNTLAQLTKRKQ